MELSILKTNVGLDIAKDDFVATIGQKDRNQQVSFSKSRKFTNSIKGFNQLIEWVKGRVKSEGVNISYTMESTGVYYEALAYYLYDIGLTVHVVLPIKAKKYFESLDQKSKTDKLDSRALAQMGAERQLREWKLDSAIYRSLKKLTREREALQNDITRLKNQLHAETHSADRMEATIKRITKRIIYLKQDLKNVEGDINELIKSDNVVSDKIRNITTIPGIGIITAAVVLSETNGFAEITSIKQLTSYAGYDIVLRESGTWRGRSRISKKGNSHIRRALHMPSLCAKTYSQTYCKFYNRINDRKQNGLVSAVAVQRKLLGLIYTLSKNDAAYIENH